VRTYFGYLLTFFCLWLIPAAMVAATEPTNFFAEWSKVDLTGPFGQPGSNWRYEAFVESRNQELRLDFSSGYRISPLLSVWSGFTWIMPNNGSADIYRPWQQVIWELFEKDSLVLLQIRSRLEQYKQEGQPEWLVRVRERCRVAFPKALKILTPVIYDEIFFNLNQPAWVNPGTIDQNRFFAGVDTLPWKNSFIEVGYLNQYRFTQPVNNVVHILSISLMIIFP
jgi:hypothetical protein